MRVAFGTDEHTTITEHIVGLLRAEGHDVEVVADGDPWPDAGRRVAEQVANGACERGVVCCWTGTGVSIAANKVPGIRAALCTDAETARGARRWNDANVLALSLRLTTDATAAGMLTAFLATAAEPDEQPNIAKLT